MNCARRLAGAREPASPSPSPSPRTPDPRPGRSFARFFLSLPALALLLGALGLFTAAPAQAQATVTLSASPPYLTPGNSTTVSATLPAARSGWVVVNLAFAYSGVTEQQVNNVPSSIFIAAGSTTASSTFTPTLASAFGGTGSLTVSISSLVGPGSSGVQAGPSLVVPAIQTAPAVLGAPPHLFVAPGNAKLDLAWTPPAGAAGSEATGYDVHYTSASATGNNAVADEGAASGSDPAAAWVAVARGTETDPPTASQMIPNLINDTPYRVRVRARNLAGNGAWALGGGTPATMVPPAAPADLAVAPGNEKLDLSWSAPPDDGGSPVTGYDVHYTSAPATGNNAVADLEAASGSDPAAAWVAVSRGAETDPPIASQTISNLTNHRAYRVRVRARNALGRGMWATAPGTPVDPASAVVSNLRQPVSQRQSLVTSVNAQGFTTGGSAGGYELIRIEAEMTVTGSLTAQDIATLRAELWSDSSGVPDSKIADLTVPSSVSTGIVAFTAPANTVLSPGMTYHLVVYSTGDLAAVESNRTPFGDEDTPRTPGWSIADAPYRINDQNLPQGGTWKPQANNPYKIRVSSRVLPTALVLTTDARDDTAGEGAGSVAVTATLDLPAGHDGVSVTLEAGGSSTAEATSDYRLPGALTIARGGTSATANVRIVDDAVDEDDETLALTAALSGPSVAPAVTGVTLTIADDDTAGVRVSTGTVSLEQGATAAWTVVLESEPTADVTVTPRSGATATATVSSGVTFTPDNWNRAQRITVKAVGSGASTVTHAVASADPKYSGLSVDSVAVTVLSPPMVSLSASPNPVGEGRSVTVAVSITRALARSVNIPVTVTMDTSESGDHGTLSSIRIASGATSGTGSITTAQDDDTEDERFTVALGTLPSILTAGSPTSVQVAIDDDDTPAVNILHARPNAVVEGGTVTLTLGLSSPLPGAVTIPLRIEDETTDANDRGSISSVTFAAGATRATGTITTVKDADTETESFKVHLAADRLPAEVSAGTRSSVRIWIGAEGSLADVWLSATPNPVAEGGTLRVTVRLEPPLDEAVTVPIDVYSAHPDKHSELTGIAVPARNSVASGTIEIYHDDDWNDERLTVHVGDVSRIIGLRAVSWISTVSVDVVVDDDEEFGQPASSVWFLPSGSNPAVTGVVRVANRSGSPGTATLVAIDDSGRAYEPVTLRLGALQTVEFETADLEAGNIASGPGADSGMDFSPGMAARFGAGAAPGEHGGTGPGVGAWRLDVQSDLDIEAAAYAIAPDGFVAPLDAVAPEGAGGSLAVPLFEPADEIRHRSLLRLVNPGESDALIAVTGVDDAGRPGLGTVSLTVPAGAACTVNAVQLESGQGLACGAGQDGLGDGHGRWRLAVASEAPIVAMNLLEAPDGRLSNLSAAGEPDVDGIWRVALFPAGSDPGGRQGLVRVANLSGRAGEVLIHAADDTDVAYPPLTLELAAHGTADVDAWDLEIGNGNGGPAPGTGAGAGPWRLALMGDIEFEAHAYVAAPDGLLTAVASPAAWAHGVALLEPGRGVLRLANPGATEATVLVTGVDDAGTRATVTVSVPAGSAVELSAAALESGEATAIVSGALGDGRGHWRLDVRSDRAVSALSLLTGPGGHTAELSGAAGNGAAWAAMPPVLPEPREEPDAGPASR